MPQKNTSVPTHVAIIPDGNRRWAKRRGLKPWQGHFKGIGDLATEIAWTAFEEGVKYLTVWGGSYDNLTKRSKVEIRMLNEAYRRFIENNIDDERIKKLGVKVRFIGEWQDVLEPETIKLIKKIQKSTEKYKNYGLTILVAYNGDREMLRAINRISKKPPKRVNSAIVKSNLWTSDLPPVDFIIRTGVDGDPHMSTGFMMWDTMYSQLFFTKKLWPDFSKKSLLGALKNYSERDRRLGE